MDISNKGKLLTFDEVRELKNGTQIYVETSFPVEHTFAGKKCENKIMKKDGSYWCLGKDFEVLCTAYEWIEEKQEKNYTWESSEDADLWMHDTFESVEECIADATKNYNYYPGDKIYIGEPNPYTIAVDASDVIECLEEQAYEFAGEAAEGWNACDSKDKKGLDRLSEKLTEVVQEWLKENGNEPNFYQITNITEVEISKEDAYAIRG